MTLPQKFTDIIEGWVLEHGGVECTKENGRDYLIEAYWRLVGKNSKEKASKCVTRLLSKYRGIIAPEYTNHGLVKKAIGENTSSHPDNMNQYNTINNPIYGPIYRAKIKEERREAATEWHNQHLKEGARPALTPQQITQAAIDIIFNINIGGWGPLSKLQFNNNFTFYFGLTKQLLGYECFRFLTKRGLPNGGRNRPVLLRSNGKVINGNAEESLNLRTMQVHRQNAVRSGSFNGIGTDTSPNRDAGFVFLVTLGIAEVGNHGRHLLGARSLQSVNPE